MSGQHAGRAPSKETALCIPGESDPFIQRTDDHTLDRKKAKYMFISDTLKGWIPLAVISMIAIIVISFGIADILKTSYHQRTSQEDADLSHGLQVIEEKGTTLIAKTPHKEDSVTERTDSTEVSTPLSHTTTVATLLDSNKNSDFHSEVGSLKFAMSTSSLSGTRLNSNSSQLHDSSQSGVPILKYFTSMATKPREGLRQSSNKSTEQRYSSQHTDSTKEKYKLSKKDITVLIKKSIDSHYQPTTRTSRFADVSLKESKSFSLSQFTESSQPRKTSSKYPSQLTRHLKDTDNLTSAADVYARKSTHPKPKSPQTMQANSRLRQAFSKTIHTTRKSFKTIPSTTTTTTTTNTTTTVTPTALPTLKTSAATPTITKPSPTTKVRTPIKKITTLSLISKTALPTKTTIPTATPPPPLTTKPVTTTTTASSLTTKPATTSPTTTPPPSQATNPATASTTTIASKPVTTTTTAPPLTTKSVTTTTTPSSLTTKPVTTTTTPSPPLTTKPVTTTTTAPPPSQATKPATASTTTVASSLTTKPVTTTTSPPPPLTTKPVTATTTPSSLTTKPVTTTTTPPPPVTTKPVTTTTTAPPSQATKPATASTTTIASSLTTKPVTTTTSPPPPLTTKPVTTTTTPSSLTTKPVTTTTTAPPSQATKAVTTTTTPPPPVTTKPETTTTTPSSLTTKAAPPSTNIKAQTMTKTTIAPPMTKIETAIPSTKSVTTPLTTKSTAASLTAIITLTIKPSIATSTTLNSTLNIVVSKLKNTPSTSDFVKRSTSSRYLRFTHSQNSKSIKKATTEQPLPKKGWKVPLHCSGEDLRGEKFDFYKAGTEATAGLLELEGDMDRWALEDDDSSRNITIHSQYMDKWGLKIYRVQADMNVNARVLWEDMVINVDETATWNKDMKKVKRLEQVNSCTDIIRQTMHEIPGLMSSRSLLLVRQWSSSSGLFNIATSSMTTPKYPDPANIVIGQLYPSGMVFVPHKDNANKSSFVWYFAVDMKLGWVPQYFIDLGFMHGQKTFIGNLRRHAETFV